MFYRGETFREKYKRIREIRACLSSVPVLALTATANQVMLRQIEACLGVVDFRVVAEVPNR